MAIRFDRDSVNLYVGFFLLTGISIGLVRIFGILAIIVPLGIFFAVSMNWRIARIFCLRRSGYFGGRRRRGPNGSVVWAYEEIRDTSVEQLDLELSKTDHGRWDLFVPSENEWKDAVPMWASERRREIIGRISDTIGPDHVFLPDDY